LSDATSDTRSRWHAARDRGSAANAREIKLMSWLPLTAEQVISWPRGMIWRATVRFYGLPITGFDRIVDGDVAAYIEYPRQGGRSSFFERN